MIGGGWLSQPFVPKTPDRVLANDKRELSRGLRDLVRDGGRIVLLAVAPSTAASDRA
jgi:hypothetical protein